MALVAVIAGADPSLARDKGGGGSGKDGHDGSDGGHGGGDKGGDDKGGDDKGGDDKGGDDKSGKGGGDSGGKGRSAGDFDDDNRPQGTRLSQDDAWKGVEDGRYVSLRSVLRTVHRRARGEVVSVDLVRTPSGRVVYDIVLLNEDRELVRICVDAARNRILTAEGR